MTTPPNVLLIAPYAPPKNAAEAIQVRRILAELDKHAKGTLVTTPVDHSGSWTHYDASLELPLNHFETMHIALPLHHVSKRIVMSYRARRWHMPDAMFWIRYKAEEIVRRLPRVPDIIYSRSYPMSAALLALRLKQRLKKPWIMHLSDPWADSPYTVPHPQHGSDEAACFLHADLITLTTAGQVAYYQKKYPEHVGKITVSPNVMPSFEPAHNGSTSDMLRLIFAGNLYGERTLQPLITAVAALSPSLRDRLRIDVYGKAQGEARAILDRFPDVLQYHGPVSFAESYAAQRAADVLVSVEPNLEHPLAHCFLPSKILESLALGKKLIAITPKGSETETLCRQGYGWAFTQHETRELTDRLASLIAQQSHLHSEKPLAPPEHYTAHHAVAQLLQHMKRLRHS